MKYVNNASMGNALSGEAGLGVMQPYHANMMDLDFQSLVDTFTGINYDDQVAILYSFKPIFRLMHSIKTKQQGSNVWHTDLISAVEHYLHAHAVDLAAATDLGGTLSQVNNFVAEMGIPADQIMIYYGNKEDFKNFFLASDFLKDADKPVGFDSMADLFKVRMYRHSYMHLGFDHYFYDILTSVTEQGATIYQFPDGDPEAEGWALEIDKNELQAFVNMPVWEQIWTFLRLTHSIVEMGAFTILTNRELPLLLNDLAGYINLLEAVEPLPVLALDIIAERDRYIFLLKHMNDSVMHYSANMKRSLQEMQVEIMVEKNKMLEKQIKDLSSKPIREVVNNHGW